MTEHDLMKIEKGTSRIALVGENFTAKFPLFLAKRALSDLRVVIRSRRMFKGFITGSEGEPVTLSFLFLRGINENRREAALTREGIDIVVPTRLSVLGLINIQDSAIV